MSFMSQQPGLVDRPEEQSPDARAERPGRVYLLFFRTKDDGSWKARWAAFLAERGGQSAVPLLAATVLALALANLRRWGRAVAHRLARPKVAATKVT